ncbi:MAG: hypothetical protein QF471_04510 [Phycisphaerales bacterium]|jgi:hypothetical protein|nr:hypothetical protein [Phycisphaerales bacterium]
MKFWTITVSAAIAITGVATAQDQASTESGGSEVVQEDCQSKVDAFLAKKGWSEGPNKGGKLQISVGTAAIRAKPGKRGYLNARKIAFTRALLDAKKQMSEYLGQSISRTMTESVVEPDESAQWKDIEAANAAASEPVDLSLFDKGMMLLHNELDQELASRDIDTSTPEGQAKAETVAKALLADRRFSDAISTMARNEVAGLTAFKTFECQPSSSQGEIYVVCAYTEKTRQMASAMLGRGGGPSKKEAGKKPPLREQLPGPDQLACTYGVQQRVDENGNVCVVAFGHGVPKTKSRDSMKTARRKAKVAADGAIRSFAGEMVGVSSSLDSAESFQEFADAAGNESSIYENAESFQEVTNTVAESLDIAGITTIWSGEVTHPISKAKFYVVVRQWSPASADQANSLRVALNKTAGSRGGAGRTAPPPTAPGSGGQTPIASGGSGSGEGAEGDDDGLE